MESACFLRCLAWMGFSVVRLAGSRAEVLKQFFGVVCVGSVFQHQNCLLFLLMMFVFVFLLLYFAL